jgi:hypothetical protein
MHRDRVAGITVDLPSDVLAVVRSLARDEGRNLGEVVTDLIRRGLATTPGAPHLTGQADQPKDDGFPRLDLGREVTTDDVRRAQDDE